MTPSAPASPNPSPSSAERDRLTREMLALTHRDTPAILSLIDQGARIEAQDFEHWRMGGERPTMLHKAVRWGNKELVAGLLARGANPNQPAPQEDHPERPGPSAMSWCNSLDTYALLLAAGGDINSQDGRGMTPLMWLARSGRPDSTAADKARLNALWELFDRHQPDLSITCEEGRTALHHATKALNEFAVKKLLERGADPHATAPVSSPKARATETPMLEAAFDLSNSSVWLSRRAQKCCELLLRAGAEHAVAREAVALYAGESYGELLDEMAIAARVWRESQAIKSAISRRGSRAKRPNAL